MLWLVNQLGENYPWPQEYTSLFGFLWDTSKKTITLPKNKTTRVEAWAKKLIAVNKTTLENLECFMGTLISTTPAVWKPPLHYRAFQRSLIISLRGGRSKSKSVRISHPSVVRELNWWASGGLRTNRTSPWRPPRPTLQIWTDASMYAGQGNTDESLSFQYPWSKQEKRKHISWLELRAAWYTYLKLASPRDVV